MIVLSSPSGAGKSSLARTMIQGDANIVPSVSVTTRGRRASEAEGIHYEFVDRAEFDRIRIGGGLLEWAQVHGNMYGTPREAVERNLSRGRDVIFDIDWQGTRSLCREMREDIVSVFLLPPSAAELQARLHRRAEDSEDVIQRRLSNARDEIAKWAEYDHVLVNADFGETLRTLTCIVEAARSRFAFPRQVPADIEEIVRDLDEGLAELTGEFAPAALRA
jgi:guanylate kinase